MFHKNPLLLRSRVIMRGHAHRHMCFHNAIFISLTVDSIANLRVADGGYDLHIWRRAAIYWTSSRRQPTSDGPPARGLGKGQTFLDVKTSLLRNVSQGLALAHVDTIVNLRLPQKAGNFST